MTDWPEDWPEDAKVGPKFLQELMRRHPGAVKVGSNLEEAFTDFFGDDNEPQKPGDDTGTTKTGSS